jgi:hypothetical protein
MILRIVSFLFVAALPAAAQTNFEVLACSNACYTNATIIRATPGYVVVDFDDGIAKVAMTNLPADLQKQYHYDPDKAAAALTADEQHRLDVIKTKAEQAKYLASLRGTNQMIRVVAVLDLFGRCQTSVGQIYLIGLPPSVSTYLAQYNQLKASVVESQIQLDNKAQAADASIGDGGNPAAVFEAMKQSLKGKGKQTTEKIHEADEAGENLSELKSRLAEIESGMSQNISVIAYPTGMKYSGLPQWQCVSPR